MSGRCDDVLSGSEDDGRENQSTVRLRKSSPPTRSVAHGVRASSASPADDPLPGVGRQIWRHGFASTVIRV